MGYLLFPIVLPWATFGYLLSYARYSPRVAQPLATFSSSFGYLLSYARYSPSRLWLPFVLPWATYCLVAKSSQRSSLMGWSYKNCQNVSKSDVCLVFISFSLALFVFRNNFFHQTLGYWLPIVSYCLTMGYIWPPIVICQM